MPAFQERGPQHTEHFVADVMQSHIGKQSFSLVCTSAKGETVLAVSCPKPLDSVVKKSLSAHYPDAKLIKSAEGSIPDGKFYKRHLRLTPDVRALRLSSEFDDQLDRSRTEPSRGLLEAVADRGDGVHASIKLHVTDASSRQRRRARRVAALGGGTLATWLDSVSDEVLTRSNGVWWERALVWPLTWFRKGDLSQDSIKKLDSHLYRVEVELQVIAAEEQKLLANKRLLTMASAFAPFVQPGRCDWRLQRRPVKSLLSLAEIATLWHPPVTESPSADMRVTPIPHLPAPIELPDGSKEEGSLPLGNTACGRRIMAAIRRRDRLHQFIIGKSGMGKSTEMEGQAVSDIQQGRGVGVVDPHSDLVESILNLIPTNRTNDVTLFDPMDPLCPSINTMHCPDPQYKSLIAANNLAVLSKVFGFDERSAPRLRYILMNALLALVGTEHASFASIPKMLLDKQFRKRVVDRIEDEHVRSVWIHDIGNWSERYEQEAMPAILNKTSIFTSTPELRRLFGRTKPDVDLRHLMDEGKVVLVSLSRGKLGDEGSRFAGSVFMTAFQNAAMSRADVHRDNRNDFFLYADEYATFVNESFAELLAQARKYGLFLTAAQQSITQVEDKSDVVMDAMFTNVWTLLSYQVAQKDAERLSAELGRGVTPEDLIGLPKHHAIVKSTVDGVPTRPYVVQTLAPITPGRRHAKVETIKKAMLRRYRGGRTTTT